MEDRRSFPSFATDLPVQVEVLSSGLTLRGRMVDIGLGGGHDREPLDVLERLNQKTHLEE